MVKGGLYFIYYSVSLAKTRLKIVYKAGAGKSNRSPPCSGGRPKAAHVAADDGKAEIPPTACPIGRGLASFRQILRVSLTSAACVAGEFRFYPLN